MPTTTSWSSARSKTSTQWVYTPATPSRWRPPWPSPIPPSKKCAIWPSTWCALSVILPADATCSLPFLPMPTKTSSLLKSIRAFLALLHWLPKQRVIQLPKLLPNSPLVTTSTSSATKLPKQPPRFSNQPSTTSLSKFHVGISINSQVPIANLVFKWSQ